MIQRIQTIYLFVAAVLTFCLFCLPFANVGNGFMSLSVTACNISPSTPLMQSSKMWPLATVTLCAAIFCLITIFLYANRVRQMKIVRYNIAVQAIVMIGMVMCCFYMQRSAGSMATVSPRFAFVIPAVNIILLILANRGIKADDDLVKSADRLR
ncbi:MAG: DUF4293 domain-containing protein [Salinivirgaceae bacterium]|nr:DUF4293 domain-containing protein [Salinivirgaceae bacterium]